MNKEAMIKELSAIIRDVPDFPKEGILFKDITTLLQDKDALRKSIDILADEYRDKGVDLVVGAEARGFIFGAALAYQLNAGFIPIRKPGKLPHKVASYTYELEYGTDTLEMHEDAIPQGAKVLIVDDLLATGGTVQAVTHLVKEQGADIVGIAFLIELGFLKGRDKLKDLPVYSVIKY
jgi:adenine phosphoribosyltransferase